MARARIVEPLAPEQLQWLHNLAESQVAEATRQENQATIAARRAAHLRECAADARQRFMAGVSALPSKQLHQLLESTDDGLREAVVAALAEAAATR